MTVSATQITAQRTTAIKELAPLLNETTPVLGAIDFNVLDQLIEQLFEAYPEQWVAHTVTLEQMALPGVLEHIRVRGLGVQAASASQLVISRRCGFLPHEIVHNAAANSRPMLRQLVEADISFSVDSFTELDRVDQIVDGALALPVIGLRITPQTSSDDGILAASHLGIGLRDHREDIIQSFKDRPWLAQLSLHFDAPPASLQQAAEQVGAIYQLAEDIEHAVGAQRVRHIHLSAGLPGNHTDDHGTPSLANHRFVHQAVVPELFDGKYELTTDFTHALTAKAGMILARVEYTKDLDGRMIAVIQADSPHAQDQPRIEAYDADGEFKDETRLYYYDVAGPSGLIGQRFQLPELEEGDVLAILDIGAHAFGAHSSFTAPVYGIRADGLLTETSVLRNAQPLEWVAEAAGVYQPHKMLYS
ncbi:MAG: hypothetical protein HLX51_07615 [Micrococcaceae bacterium]|nr:hypothetical protein [Micrococcaceae bacterium]